MSTLEGVLSRSWLVLKQRHIGRRTTFNFTASGEVSVQMFRASPWINYEPSGGDSRGQLTLPTDHHPAHYNNRARLHYNIMNHNVDMEAPQISTLRDEESPPPPPNPTRGKFRVNLLVGEKIQRKNPAPRVASDDDEDEEQDELEEDQLIDDDDDAMQAKKPLLVILPPLSGKAKPPPKKRARKPEKQDSKTSKSSWWCIPWIWPYPIHSYTQLRKHRFASSVGHEGAAKENCCSQETCRCRS